MNQINTAENRQSDAKMISKTFFRLLPIQFLLIAIGSIGGYRPVLSYCQDYRGDKRCPAGRSPDTLRTVPWEA